MKLTRLNNTIKKDEGSKKRYGSKECQKCRYIVECAKKEYGRKLEDPFDPILDEIKKYPVTTIELGCQSLDDEVLRLNHRGHTAEDVKKASADELRNYFASVLPTFDRDRVHNSDIKKLIQWYNLLLKNGLTDFTESAEDEGEEKVEKNA